MKRLIPIIFLLTVSGCSETVWRVERKPETVYTEGVQSERLHADSLLDIFDWKICGDVVAVMTSDLDQYLCYFQYIDSNGKYLVRAFESIEKIDIYRIDAGSEVCPEVAIEGDIQVPDMENMHYTGVSCGTTSFAVLHYSAADAAYNIELYDYSGRQLANIRAGNSCVALLYDEQRRTVYTGDESEDVVYITRYNLPVCRKN